MQAENADVIDVITQRLVIAPVTHKHLDECTRIAERALGRRNIDITTEFCNPRKFSSGEFCPVFQLERGKDLQGKSVYILVPPGPVGPTAEDLVQRACLTAFDAKEHGAEKVVIVEFDFSHGRQDRGHLDDPNCWGEPSTVRWRARQYHAAGVDQVIATHAHSTRIPAYFALEYGLVPPEKIILEARSKPVSKLIVPHDVNIDDEQIKKLGTTVFKSLPTSSFLADYILHQSSLVGTKYLRDDGRFLAIKVTDKGNISSTDELYQALFLPLAVRVRCSKARKSKNDPKSVEVDILNVLGDFTSLDGMCEVYGDDGADTAGTLIKCVNWSEAGNVCSATGKSYGRPEERLVYFTHPWLAGESYEAIQRSLFNDLPAKEFVTTNTRPYIGDHQYYRFKPISTVLRLAGLWADAIIANELGLDITTRYQQFLSQEEQHRLISPLYALKRHSQHFLNETEPTRRKQEFLLRLEQKL